MNLRDLRYLVAIADHRHFGRAAEACFVSQPTLSTQLRKLETELGVELVERNPGNILLTPAGEQVVERARAMLVEEDAIVGIARRAREPESGRVRVGLFPTSGPYLLPHAVAPLRARFPRLELELVEEKSAEILRRLRDGRLDVGILAAPVEDEPHLHEERLFTEPFVLAVPAGHRLARTRGRVAASVLGGEDVLLLDDGHCLREHALAVCRRVGAGEHHGFRATSLETLRQMVAAGAGVTLLPELSVRPPVAASPLVRLIPFAEPVPARTIAAYWRVSSPLRALLPEVAAVLAAAGRDALSGSVRSR